MSGRPALSRSVRAGRGVVLALAAATLMPVPARAQTPTAADLYDRGTSRAADARQTPTLGDLRAAVKAYEAVVLRYPRSGYCDNALWEGASLASFTHDLFGEAADLQTAERLLQWLVQEYPHSSYVAQARALLAHTPDPGAPPAAAESAADPPATPVEAAVPTGPAAVVKSVVRTPLPRGDRITIEFSHEVAYEGQRIADPDRVFFDFRNAVIPSTLFETASDVTGTFLQTLRVGRHPDRTARIVLELDGKPRYSVFPMYKPFRLVVDIEGDAPAAKPDPDAAATDRSGGHPAAESAAPVPAPFPASQTTGAAPGSVGAAPALKTVTPPAAAPPPASAPRPPRVVPPPSAELPITSDPSAVLSGGVKNLPVEVPVAPSSTSKGDYSLARQLGVGVARIVIDPGHGGHDPGAQANGIDEAELVLDLSLRLEKLLKAQPGFEVVLTRRTDEFVPLEERTAIANRENADLFLSVHANASRQVSVSGVETYFLNFATNPAAEAVAARENATSSRTMGNVPEIVKAIVLNNKVEESREVAAIVQTSMMRRLRTQNKGLHDLGVKQAPFVVLIGATMPSVLAESLVPDQPRRGGPAQAVLLSAPHRAGACSTRS